MYTSIDEPADQPATGFARVLGRRVRWTGVLGAALAGLVMFGNGRGVAEPTSDAPGTLVSREPINDPPAGSVAWRIRYRSMADSGALVEISGIVIIPTAPAPKAGRDVVAWGHATVGIAQACAPSTNAKLFENIAGLPTMIAAGYVVTATDFQGLGTQGPHPFLVGVSSGRAMLDSVRAARALPSADASKRYVLWGESQGAHAALWAARITATYAPDLRLLGVAAAAPPTDLVANFDAITNPLVKALMTAFTSESWSKIYGLDLATFSNAAGRILIRDLANKCVHVSPVAAAGDTGLLVLSRQIPSHLGAPWTQPLHDNSVQAARLGVPLLVAQGLDDSVVIPSVTHDFIVGSCRAGNAVRSILVEGGDHITIAARSKDSTLPWIADRFANRPAPSDCGAITAAANTP